MTTALPLWTEAFGRIRCEECDKELDTITLDTEGLWLADGELEIGNAYCAACYLRLDPDTVDTED